MDVTLFSVFNNTVLYGEGDVLCMTKCPTVYGLKKMHLGDLSLPDRRELEHFDVFRWDLREKDI